MKPEELELINSQIELMLSIQYRGMNAAQRQQLEKSMAEIKLRYEEAAKKRDAQDADEKTRAYYAGICNSIATGLPNITKGALAAGTAFRKGDYLNGSAAIMDICAAAAPIIGSLFTAGGPPGALLGALFSVIGQLLSFFGPQQPSLTDQIKDMMLGLEAEQKLRTMYAVGDSIDVYADKLQYASQTLPEILKLPLKTQEDADQFLIRCEALKIGLARDQNRLDTPAFNNWEVLEWLRQKDRQDLDKWPEVLSVFCQSYIKLINANVLFNCWPDRNTVYGLLKDTQEDSTTTPLPAGVKRDIHTILRDLQAMALAYSQDWKIYNRKVLELVQSIEEPARYRGLFLHVGSGYLYGGTGRRDIVDSNSWHYLWAKPDSNGSGFGYISKMTTTLAWGDMGSSASPYHCFLLRPENDWLVGRVDGIEYRTIRASNPPTVHPSQKGSFSDKNQGGTWIKWLPGFDANPLVTDLWAIPGGWPDKPNEVWLYFAVGSRIVELELNEQGVVENRGWQSRDARSQVVTVRSVYPESVRDDPDGTIKTVFSRIDPEVNTLTHYGGMADSRDIFVVKHDGYVHGYVPTPWTRYLGIGVDQHYLWVFGTGGFACATHTSVVKALNERAKGNTESKPRWIEHYPNKLLYKGLSTGDGLVEARAREPELQGVRDLSPCDDGTLMASVVTRSYDGSGKMQGDDGPYMCTASYRIDIKAGTLRVGDWTRLTGVALQVQKQPIYCWPAFESLKGRLIAEG